MDLPLADNFVATPGRFLFHPPTATAILSDLHLGVEAELRAAGNVMPDFAGRRIAESWGKLVARHPRRIVVAGDLFHSQTPARETMVEAVTLLTSVEQACDVVVIGGNHDPLPAEMARIFSGTSARVAPLAEVGDWTVCHGDDLSALAAPRPRLIVGHQHPAVIFEDRARSAKMICFAVVSDHRGPRMILLPAFSPAPLGSNLRSLKNWIIDAPPPEPRHVRIAGIVKGDVLDFGPLDQLG